MLDLRGRPVRAGPPVHLVRHPRRCACPAARESHLGLGRGRFAEVGRGDRPAQARTAAAADAACPDPTPARPVEPGSAPSGPPYVRPGATSAAVGSAAAPATVGDAPPRGRR